MSSAGRFDRVRSGKEEAKLASRDNRFASASYKGSVMGSNRFSS